MSDRTDSVFNALAKALKDIEDAITAIKTRQKIGTDSIRLYKNLSAAGKTGAFDIDYTSTAGKNWSVTFKSDTQKAAFCDLSLETYIDGRRVNESELQRFDVGQVFFNTLVSDYFLVYSPLNPTLGAGMGWYFFTGSVSGAPAHHIQVRCVVNATDTGTVTVTQI
jgi:hypothetical protein